MKNLLKKIFLTLVCVLLLFFFLAPNHPISSVTEEKCKQKQNIDEEIACWKSLLGEVGERKLTLRSEIDKFNTSIALTIAKITQTVAQINELEKEIANLTIKIGRLDISLDQLSEILVRRIAETYKKGRIDSLALLLSSSNFSNFIGRYKYLRVIQLHDRKLMIQMETVRTNYAGQRTVKEEKQEELEVARKKLESQKALLAQQKADKERLLTITQNDEKRFQTLLAQARAELIAIRGILAGQGKEVKVGAIGEGEKIATLIQGESCNSSGTHLHFMVTQNSSTPNPFDYLNGNISYTNCSGSGSWPNCDTGDNDPFNPRGSWNWPLNSPIILTQGYDYTWAIQHTWVGNIYQSHNGVDIVSDSSEVKAVRAGKLYQGIYEGGCNLSYVRVDHDDSDLDTLYLHVNY